MGMGWIIANGLGGASREILDQKKQQDKDAEEKQRWESMYALQKIEADRQAERFELEKARNAGASFSSMLQQQTAASPAAQAQSVQAPAATASPAAIRQWDTSMAQQAQAPAAISSPAAPAAGTPAVTAASPAAASTPATSATPNASTYTQAAGQGQQKPTSVAELLRSQYGQIEAQQSTLKQAMEAEADKRGYTGQMRDAFLAPAGERYQKLQEAKFGLEEKMVGAELQESANSIAQLMMMNPKGMNGSQMVKQLKESGVTMSKSTESLLSMVKPSTQKFAGQSIQGYLVPTPTGAPSFVPDFVAVRLLAGGDIKGFADAAQQWAEHKGDLTMRMQAMSRESSKAGMAQNYALLAAKGLSVLNGGGKWNDIPLDQQAAILTVNPAAGMVRDWGKESSRKTREDYQALTATYDKMDKAYRDFAMGNISQDDLSERIKNIASGYVAGGQNRSWDDVAKADEEIRSRGWFRGNETVQKVTPQKWDASRQGGASVSPWSPQIPKGGKGAPKVSSAELARAKAEAAQAVRAGADRSAVAKRLKEMTGYEGSF